MPVGRRRVKDMDADEFDAHEKDKRRRAEVRRNANRLLSEADRLHVLRTQSNYQPSPADGWMEEQESTLRRQAGELTAELEPGRR